jgi:integrase
MSSHLAALRSFYRWATASGRLDHDPTLLVRSIRVPTRDMEPVPKVILDRALLLSDNRTRFALLLGSRAGLRREEIATLSDQCVSRGHLVIVGKGSKQRRIPIHPDLRPYLDELTAHPGWAFPSSRLPGCHVTPETIQKRVTAALGEPWTTHSLRRYFALACYDATRDIRAVQALLGHTSPATTARYVRADEDSMRAAVLAVA